MNHRPVLLSAILLGLTACADAPYRSAPSTAGSRMAAAEGRLTVHIVEAAKPG